MPFSGGQSFLHRARGVPRCVAMGSAQQLYCALWTFKLLQRDALGGSRHLRPCAHICARRRVLKATRGVSHSDDRSFKTSACCQVQALSLSGSQYDNGSASSSQRRNAGRRTLVPIWLHRLSGVRGNGLTETLMIHCIILCLHHRTQLAGPPFSSRTLSCFPHLEG